MKRILRILLILILLDFGVGFYLLNQEHPFGNKVVGIGVLVFACVLLPLFLYHRYKGKKLKDYALDKEKMDQIIDNLNS